MQIPHANPGAVCPLHRKDVSKVCHTCAWWVGLPHGEPNKPYEMMWHCALVKSMIVMVDLVKSTDGVQKATESFRNETVKNAGLTEGGVAAQMANVIADRLAQQTTQIAQAITDHLSAQSPPALPNGHDTKLIEG